ncbi:MAG: hypothetical protein H7X86_01975 [Gorillibacterium sp.]|nr:hypothetical protein [Gorillibacterium sp.]
MKHLDQDRFTLQTIKPERTLQSGEIIELSMLRMVTIASAAHQPDALVETEELVGKVVVVPIGREEELAKWKLTVRQIVPLQDERYYSFKTDSVANVNNMIRKGDRVDVWVEFKSNETLETAEGEKITSIKIIEGLQVSGVKSAEGIEISDRISLDSMLTSDAEQLSSARGKPSGVPLLNTYIMSDEVYQAYAAASAIGTIRLALPNLMESGATTAQVTVDFDQWLRMGRLNTQLNAQQGKNIELAPVIGNNQEVHEPLLSENSNEGVKEETVDSTNEVKP